MRGRDLTSRSEDRDFNVANIESLTGALNILKQYCTFFD